MRCHLLLKSCLQAIASKACARDMGPKAKAKAGKQAKPKKSAAEQVASLQKRAQQLEFKDKIEDINFYLEEMPWLSTSTLQHLQSLAAGKIPQKLQNKKNTMLAICDGSPGGAPPPSPVAAGSSGDVHVTAAEPSQQEHENRRQIPRCYQDVRSIPPAYLVDVISEVEVISLSKNSLRGITTKGAKYPPKERLLELFEAISGLAPEDYFPPWLHVVSVLVLHCKAYTLFFGRPFKELRLPMSWPADGFWGLQVKHKPPLLTFKFFEADRRSKPLPDKFLATVTDVTKLVVNFNFSVLRAVVADSEGFAKILCQLVFPEEVATIVVKEGTAVEHDTSPEPGSPCSNEGRMEPAIVQTPPAKKVKKAESSIVPPPPSGEN